MSTRFVLCLVAAGCNVVEPSPVGDSALGIASFEIHETSSHLAIVGVDAEQRLVATIDVERGPFELSESFAEDRAPAERFVVGRRMDIVYRDTTLHHESQGFDRLELPLPP